MKINIFWFRRDLRLNDNKGLWQALKSGLPVLPIFIFDSDILDKLHDKNDARVNFIHQALHDLKQALSLHGSDIHIMHGSTLDCWNKLIASHDIQDVYYNEDFEPYAIKRDQTIEALLQSKGIGFYSSMDHCIFRYDEVLKDDGKPYTVFTPYAKKWKQRLQAHPIESYPSQELTSAFLKISGIEFPSLDSIGFSKNSRTFPEKTVQSSLIKHYTETRNIPSIEGTSRLSIHFRFGTISIREKALKALQLNETWLNELIWRDFYIQIMAHFPYAMTSAFKKDYDHIEWRNNEQEFDAWCNGQTGYPIVDAGMHELNETGFMHNRVRMIVSSFLCKHLLIDWRWGEAYFARLLNDFELASNNGGWQWAAGSGVDAAPYFRIFNPSLQTERFDPKAIYIKQWVKNFNSLNYPAPIVDHSFARKRCLEVYKIGLAKSKL